MSSGTSAPVRKLQCPLSLQQCHQSLEGFLMPLNSMQKAEIWQTWQSNHYKITKNFIRNLSPSQEDPVSSWSQAMSSIFRRVLDAFELDVESWNLAYMTIKSKKQNHQKRHQELQPQSWSCSVLLRSTKNVQITNQSKAILTRS